MYKRMLIPLLAVSAAIFAVGCNQTDTSPIANSATGVAGYWLQQTAKRPMSLHIQETDNDYVVKVGRLNFGDYDITTQPAKLSDTGVLTIGQRKQLRLDPATDILSDVDHATIRFARITKEQYDQASRVAPKSTKP